MQQVIEGMMGVFFLIILVFTGMGIAGALVHASEAQNFKMEVIERLEDCNYESEVIDACFQEAVERGLELSVKLYYSDGNIVTFTQSGISEQNRGIVTSGKVSVRYAFQIPFLHISEQLVTTGSLL